MSNVYGAIGIILALAGVYYLGHSAGTDSCKASQADAKNKAAEKSKKQANEILSLKEDLEKATGKKIYVIKKVKDETGCLDSSLDAIGLDGLL